MRTIALSLIRREHAHDLVADREAFQYPLNQVTRAVLCFREHNAGTKGADLERVALMLTGVLPDIGLDLETEPRNWERQYGIWNTICCREGAARHCKRAFAVMINADRADKFERDIAAVAGDRNMVIGALTSVFTGCRENNDPPLTTVWPDDDVSVDLLNGQCVFVAVHVNTLNRGEGESSRWRVVRNARVTKTGVIVSEEEFNGFAGLQHLVLGK